MISDHHHRVEGSISVVTICFNQEKFISSAIESVLSQSHPAFEYVVLDAGSTDKSREIIRRYESHLTAVIFEPDSGPPDGLNKAFAATTGDVLCYINSDDGLLPGALEVATATLKAHPEIDVLMGHGIMCDEEGRAIRSIYSSVWDNRKFAYGAVSAVQQSTFIRRRNFDRVGGFNTKNLTCWDAELLVDLAMDGARFELLHECLGMFRLHKDSISGSGRMADKYRADKERLFEKIMNRKRKPTDGFIEFGMRAKKKLRSIMSGQSARGCSAER